MEGAVNQVWQQLRRGAHTHPDDIWDIEDYKDNISVESDCTCDDQKKDPQKDFQPDPKNYESERSDTIPIVEQVLIPVATEPANSNIQRQLQQSLEDSDGFGSPYLIGSSYSLRANEDESLWIDLPNPSESLEKETPFVISEESYQHDVLTLILREMVMEHCKSPIDVSVSHIDKQYKLLNEIHDHFKNIQSYCHLLRLAEQGYSVEEIYKTVILRKAWRKNPDFWSYRVGTRRRKYIIRHFQTADLTWSDAALIASTLDVVDPDVPVPEDWLSEWETLNTRSFFDAVETYIKYSPLKQHTYFSKYAVERAFSEANLEYDNFHFKKPYDDENFPRDIRLRIETLANNHADKVALLCDIFRGDLSNPDVKDLEEKNYPSPSSIAHISEIKKESSVLRSSTILNNDRTTPIDQLSDSIEMQKRAVAALNDQAEKILKQKQQSSRRPISNDDR